MPDPDAMNCLFCYCPLYALKDRCGGNFRYLTSGIKDCSGCSIPHSPGGYQYVMERMPDVMRLGMRGASPSGEPDPDAGA